MPLTTYYLLLTTYYLLLLLTGLPRGDRRDHATHTYYLLLTTYYLQVCLEEIDEIMEEYSGTSVVRSKA